MLPMLARTMATVWVASIVLAGCDAPSDQNDATKPVRDRQSQLDAVDGFTDVGGVVAALALMPNPEAPWLGRAIAALEDGGFAILDLNDMKVASRDGPAALALAIAPDFTLRGSKAPLVLAAGGDLSAPAAFVYIAEGDELLPAPSDPIAPTLAATGVCFERGGEAVVDFIVFGASAAERWRLRDTGAETLTAEKLGDVEADVGTVACAAAPYGAPAVLGVDGRLNRFGSAATDWSTTAAGGSDLIVIEAGPSAVALVARPDLGALEAVTLDVEGPRTRLVVDAALNAPGLAAPRRLAASVQNFGGVFADGVLVVADGRSVVALALPSVTAAIDAPRE